MNGEDSLFLHDCLKAGLKIYMTTVGLGHEEAGESTWFKGYNDKFFYDRGVLYRYLYGPMKKPFAMLFLLRHRKKMCTGISMTEAYRLMRKGMAEG